MENINDLWAARLAARHPIFGSSTARQAVAEREEMLVQHLRRGCCEQLRRQLKVFGTTDGFVPTSCWGNIQSDWAHALLARV